MNNLTVIIPTGNEIHNIEAVIASVNFADKVLVVDADERITLKLKEEILDILKKPKNNIVAYWIGKLNHFIRKRLNYFTLKSYNKPFTVKIK